MYNKSFSVQRYKPNILSQLSYARLVNQINYYEFYNINKNKVLQTALDAMETNSEISLGRAIIKVKKYIHDM